jgi:hypothetical protein
VTEAEWLACTDLELMLEVAFDRASPRKRRLFACACLRRFRRLLRDPRARAAVEVAEQFADGRAGPQDLALAWHAVRRAQESVREGSPMDHVLDAAEWLVDDRALPGGRNAVWSLLLDVVREEGSAASRAAFLDSLLKLSTRSLGPWLPWHQVRAPASDVEEAERQAGDAYRKIVTAEREAQAALLREILGPIPSCPPAVAHSVLAWNDACVVKLAGAVYDGLVWDRLPVLADALEEAGCTDAAILNHCRESGEHVRGCWVLDLIMDRG